MNIGDTVTITHKITPKGVETAVRMRGRKPITKTWVKMKDGSFVLDDCVTWDEVGLPASIANAAERGPTDVCGLLADA